MRATCPKDNLEFKFFGVLLVTLKVTSSLDFKFPQPMMSYLSASSISSNGFRSYIPVYYMYIHNENNNKTKYCFVCFYSSASSEQYALGFI